MKCLYEGEVLDHVKVFDKIRVSRHNVQYGGARVGNEEADFVIEFARDFLKASLSELTKSKRNWSMGCGKGLLDFDFEMQLRTDRDRVHALCRSLAKEFIVECHADHKKHCS